MPALAMLDSAPGAIAFAKFFIQTLDWGYATTSSAYMRHYYLPTCTLCEGLSKSVDTTRARQHHFIGDRLLNLRAVQIPVAGKAADAAVRVTFDITGNEVVTLDGKYVSADAPVANYADNLYLSRQGQGWVVSDMELVK